jgi:hypothetical protein
MSNQAGAGILDLELPCPGLKAQRSCVASAIWPGITGWVTFTPELAYRAPATGTLAAHGKVFAQEPSKCHFAVVMRNEKAVQFQRKH